MKRKMAYVITCLLVSGLCFNTTFKANASKKESISQTDISANNKYEILENNHGIEENTLVYSFPVNKENAAGYEPANDHEEIGPDAFFISGDTIFIDDTANHQIVVYDKGVYRKSIPLPANMNVMLMFYDASNDILKMVYEELWREDGTDLYLYLTSVCVSEDTEPEPGDKICKNNEMPLQYCFDMDGNLLTEYFQDSSELLYVDEMSVYRDVLTLGQGISYEACTTYTSMPKGGVVTEYILKNDPDDTETYAVPENHEDALTRGNIQVSQEGSIYQMVVDLDSIRIYKLCEKTDSLAEENKLVRIVGIADEDEVDTKAIYANYKNMTTTKIRNRMDKYYNLSWTFNSKNNSNKSVTGDKSKVTQPDWLQKIADGKNHKVTNVPYCWGGWNAESFIENINNGKFAGNINTTSSGLISGTVGMDCSGYVSVAFDLPYKHGTSTLSQCFKERTNEDNISAYDILNKVNDHVHV